MVSKLKALREQRDALAKEVRALNYNFPGKDWKPEHQAQYDAHMSDIERIDGEIKREERVLDLNAEERFQDAVQQVEREPAARRKLSEAHARVLNRANQVQLSVQEALQESAFSALVRGGLEALSSEQIRALREISNTLSTTTNSQGGYTVPVTIVPQFIDELKAFGGMRAVADQFATADGRTMQYPTTDGTAEVGEIIAQNTAANALDPSFGSVSLNVYKFGSKIITVPFELLQDTVIDIEGLIRKRIGQRIGRIQNTKYTVGAGDSSSEPNGVVTAATLGKTGTTGQTLTIIYDDLVDLEHSVDPAYRALGNCKWMMADSSLKVIRKLKDTAGRPLFLPAYSAGIVGASAPNELMGYPIQINQDVAAMAANAKSVLFGDFSFYKIRDTLEMMLFRFTDSAYASKAQVGFLAWMRSGGNLVDAKAVYYYANSAT